MENIVINDRYITTTEIGHGGYAKVFLAFDKITSTYVAIKLLKCDIEKEKKSYSMFKQEAMTLAAIENPYVVKVHESGVHENNPYLVMDYIKGKSLKKIINENGYLLVDEVYSYFSQILMGMEACHNANIIHRDLKPLNIVKKADGAIVILDFGLAFIPNEDVNLYEIDPTSVACTVQYMAPELVENPEGTIQTDIYALGITMYEMFTGKCPFNSADPNDKIAVIKMHQHTAFPSVRKINPSVPESFEKIIYKCCDKDPSKRYKNVNELYCDLLMAYDEYKNPKVEKKSFWQKIFKKEK